MSESRRTYIVRVCYALALFCAFLIAFYFHFESARQRGMGQFIMTMGHGNDLITALIWMLFLGLYVFLPVLVAPVIAQEKEQGSLPLLLVTRMRPLELVLQKYFSGIVPMLSFLLLALPLLAIAYAFGGVSSHYVSFAIVVLLLTCLQIAAYCLMISTLCPTTMSAVTYSYLGFVFWLFIIFFAHGVLRVSNHYLTSGLLGPFVYFNGCDSTITQMTFLCAPIVISTIVFLLISWRFLFSRATSQKSQFLQRLFRSIDVLMNVLNRKLGRGIVLVPDRSALPLNDPVAWRERGRTTMANSRYLVRLMLIILVPTCIASFFCKDMPVLVVAYWIIATFLTALHCTNMIGAERSQQTLDILLSTPIEVRYMITQKMKSLRPMIIVVVIPLAAVSAMYYSMVGWSQYDYAWTTDRFLMLALSVASALIYLPLIGWFSCAVGLRIRNRAKALVAALGLVTGIVIVMPVLFFVAVSLGEPPDADYENMMVGLFPVFSLGTLLFPGEQRYGPTIANLVFHASLLFAVRTWTLGRAEDFLRR